MRAHPIPQNVVSFEDRIFGTLTAKQFSIIATGFTIAFAMYMSPLPMLTKVPLIIIIVLVSLAAGLLRINGMYLDAWLMTLLSAVYAPTQFVWEKETKVTFLELNLQQQSAQDAYAARYSKKLAAKTAKRALPQDLFQNEEEQDKTESEFLSQLNFGLDLPANFNENAAAKIPAKTFNLATDLKNPVTTKEPAATLVLPKSDQPVKPQPIPVVQPKNVFPEKKQVPSSPIEGVVAPLASEINFVEKPVFSMNISGRAPQYMQGLSNQTINRPLSRQKIENPQIIFPIKDEKKLPLRNLEMPLESESAVQSIPVVKIERKPAENPIPEPAHLEHPKELKMPEIKTEVKEEKPVLKTIPIPTTSPTPKAVIKTIPELKVTPAPTTVTHLEPPPLIENPITKNDQDLSTHLTKETITKELKEQKEEVKSDPHVFSFQAQNAINEKDAAKTKIPAVEINKEAPLSAREVLSEPPAVEEKKPEEFKEPASIPAPVEKLMTTPSIDWDKDAPPVKQTPIETISTPQNKPIDGKSAERMALEKKIKMMTKEPGITPPQIPNIIAGMVKDKNGMALPNVIIIIKDDSDNPVRALKTNRLGQFSIATPLPNGSYAIGFEKEGCQFGTTDLELKGDLIPLVIVSEL